MKKGPLRDLGPPDPPAETRLPVHRVAYPTPGAWVEVFIFKDDDYTVRWHRTTEVNGELVKSRVILASELPVLVHALNLAYAYCLDRLKEG